MISCLSVTFVATKPSGRPLVEELVLPLTFRFTDATSKATSVEVTIGPCAGVTTDDITTAARTARPVFITTSLDVLPPFWLDSRGTYHDGDNPEATT